MKYEIHFYIHLKHNESTQEKRKEKKNPCKPGVGMTERDIEGEDGRCRCKCEKERKKNIRKCDKVRETEAEKTETKRNSSSAAKLTAALSPCSAT